MTSTQRKHAQCKHEQQQLNSNWHSRLPSCSSSSEQSKLIFEAHDASRLLFADIMCARERCTEICAPSRLTVAASTDSEDSPTRSKEISADKDSHSVDSIWMLTHGESPLLAELPLQQPQCTKASKPMG